MTDRVSVVGLGRLGECLAACFASRGFETIGVDLDEKLVTSVNDGIPTAAEPRLKELFVASRMTLRATQSHSEAIRETDVTIILVATPSDPNGRFSNKYLESTLESLASCLQESNKPYHLLVIASTVMPGSIDGELIPLVERVSGRSLNDGFGVCYCPEFVALGNAVSGFLRPDLVVIGESDRRAGDVIASVYSRLCENTPEVFQMPIVSAEVTKISLNCFLTLKISFANSLANICERMPGTDLDVVTRALGADSRIGAKYLRGGPSYGGTCFPRDTRAFTAFATQLGTDAPLIRATEEVNEFQDRHLAAVVLEETAAMGERAVSVLGLSFKCNTPVIVESPAIRLIRTLVEERIRVSVYDPLAMESTKSLFGNSLLYATSALDCVSQSRVCVITTDAREFSQLDGSCFPNHPTTVIDCWRVLDPSKLGRGVRWVALGRARTTPEHVPGHLVEVAP